MSNLEELRLVRPKHESPVPGETGTDRNRRAWRNKKASMEWKREALAKCAVCGQANLNVVHNVRTVDQLEGPDYYADIDDLHEFQALGVALEDGGSNGTR